MNVKLTAQQKSKPIYTATDHAFALPCWAGLACGVYSIMQPILLRENKQRRKQEYFWARASPLCLRQAGYGSASMGIDDERYLQFVELLAHAYSLAGLGGQNRVHIKPALPAGRPAEAFRISIQKNADFVIFVHNPRLTERGRHPAGKLQPSPEDKDATDSPTGWGLKAADTAYGGTSVVDIKVVDHFIITERKYYSFVPD